MWASAGGRYAFNQVACQLVCNTKIILNTAICRKDYNNYKDQTSSRAAYSHSAGQETPRLSWKCGQKCMPLVPILSRNIVGVLNALRPDFSGTILIFSSHTILVPVKVSFIRVLRLKFVHTYHIPIHTTYLTNFILLSFTFQ